MHSYQCVMAVVALLAGAAAGAFILVVIGIRKGDRVQDLLEAPDTTLDALTRRALSLGFRRQDK